MGFDDDAVPLRIEQDIHIVPRGGIRLRAVVIDACFYFSEDAPAAV
jgi:hypothetical protein